MRMQFAVKFQPFPSVFKNIETHTRNLRVFIQKMRGQPLSKDFDRFDLLSLAGKSINCVFHCVGGKAQAVVAHGVDGFKIAFERDIHGNILYFVNTIGASNL